MIVRFFLLSVLAFAQDKPPLFYSWHAFEAVLFDNGKTELDAQFHFRTRDHFSVFQFARGSIYTSRRVGAKGTVGGGYFVQRQEAAGRWTPQQRAWVYYSYRVDTGRWRHTPRVQADRIFGTPDPAYTRYRFAWQTEWRAKFSPYAGVEEFVENAGRQRTRPRAGVRFAASSTVDMDIGYIYDHIYLRSPGDRHILQTTFSFHKR